MQRQDWSRWAITGCVQSGKTLSGVVIPVLYHVFELKESVIYGTPTMEMAGDKWRKEILPVINRVPEFRRLLPAHGRGSRGGDKLEAITFRHGPEIRFMSGGGRDEQRSGYTSRVVAITEADKFDVAGERSRESDPITQLEARTSSYGEDAIIYMECTTSIEEGRIWQEIKAGSDGRIACPCPHCGQCVTPEREHFLGWEQSENEIDASEKASWFCPSCGEAITDEERAVMNSRGVVVHQGQRAVVGSDGFAVATGPLPPTKTCGFRWNAFNNLFWSSRWLGAQEWHGKRAIDEDNAEKEACQFRWAVPWKPSGLEEVPVTVDSIRKRQAGYIRGQVPEDTKWITVGLDVGKYLCHWTAIAWRANRTGHVIDYGRIEVPTADVVFERAIVAAFKEFHERLGTTWTLQKYSRVLVDSRYKSAEVVNAIRSLSDKRWSPAIGLGSGHYLKRRYTAPSRVSGRVAFIGREYYIARMKERPIYAFHVNADAWKTWLHEAMASTFDKSQVEVGRGGITLFASMDPNEHLSYAKHLTAEKRVTKFEPGKGMVQVWEAIRDANHWLDATSLACVGGHKCGFRIEEQATAPVVLPGVVGGR